MFNRFHDSQVFHTVIVMATVNVVNLFARFKRFDKRIGDKTMD